MEAPTRGLNVWNANIVNSSATESVYVDVVTLWWWGGDKLEKASLGGRLIWIADPAVYSPQTLTFYNTAPVDLLILKETSKILQFTFMTNNFYMGSVRVFLSNGCYVQYWYDW